MAEINNYEQAIRHYEICLRNQACDSVNARKNIDELVVNSAKDTLILTAMSQNGFVDFIVVLTNNFRMIKKIIVMCGFRPTFMRTLKLYINVFFS